MPIVDQFGRGLRRYAVFSFVEDTAVEKGNTINRKFPHSPLTSASEAAARLSHTELFHMKRLKSVENKRDYPYLDVTFFSTFEKQTNVAELIESEDCINLHNPAIHLQKGVYEELQLVDPKRDMVTTPIDASETSESKSKTEDVEEEKKHRGYILLAYKTMEDMYNRSFVSSWKTWTGVRYICMQLPRQLGLRRISFYRQLSDTSSFAYVLLIEISNLMVYAPQTLNLMDRLKLRLCGYCAIYREKDFHLDHATAATLNIDMSHFRSASGSVTGGQISLDQKENNRAKTGFVPDASPQSGQNDGSRRQSKDRDRDVLRAINLNVDNGSGLKKATGRIKEPGHSDDAQHILNAQKIVKELSKKLNSQNENLAMRPPASPQPQRRSIQSSLSIITDGNSSFGSRKMSSTSSAADTRPPTRDPSIKKEPEDEEMTLNKQQKKSSVVSKSSVEAMIHVPPPVNVQPSRFAGKGRHYQSELEGFRNAVSGSVDAANNVSTSISPLSQQQNVGDQPRKHVNIMDQRRKSLISSAKLPPPISTSNKPRHHVVEDLGRAEKKLTQQPKYEMPPQTNFHEIVAMKRQAEAEAEADKNEALDGAGYNSPIFSRTEWKERSEVYGNRFCGDNTMENIAETLGNPPAPALPPPQPPPLPALPTMPPPTEMDILLANVEQHQQQQQEVEQQLFHHDGNGNLDHAQHPEFQSLEQQQQQQQQQHQQEQQERGRHMSSGLAHHESIPRQMAAVPMSQLQYPVAPPHQPHLTASLFLEAPNFDDYARPQHRYLHVHRRSIADPYEPGQQGYLSGQDFEHSHQHNGGGLEDRGRRIEMGGMQFAINRGRGSDAHVSHLMHSSAVPGTSESRIEKSGVRRLHKKRSSSPASGKSRRRHSFRRNHRHSRSPSPNPFTSWRRKFTK